MLIIKHRVNSIKQLLDTPENLGVEVDIRSYKEDLILQSLYIKIIFTT